jgi:hypothetical protein
MLYKRSSPQRSTAVGTSPNRGADWLAGSPTGSSASTARKLGLAHKLTWSRPVNRMSKVAPGLFPDGFVARESGFVHTGVIARGWARGEPTADVDGRVRDVC